MDKNKKRKNTFLSFGIGKETFAVSVSKVLEVLEKQYITEIPNVPSYIKGVINFRGNIIPVIESRTKFGLSDRPKGEKYVIIVFDLRVKDKKNVVGAIADKVNDVLSFEEKNIQQVPSLGVKYNTEFLSGMIKNGDSFTMILDIDKVFSEEEVNLMNETVEIQENEPVEQETEENN